MSGDREAQALEVLLDRSGVAIPRGLCGPATRAVAAALAAPAADDLDELVTAAADETWGAMRPLARARLERHAQVDPGIGTDALEAVMGWAARRDGGHPLARALVVRAARELLAVRVRVAQTLHGVESAAADGAGAEHAVAIARACGAVVAMLLDLDPEDYADEIAAYVDAGEDRAALDDLARSTGDVDTRAWARRELRAVDVPDAPAASAAVRALAEGPLPPDAAEDAVWVPALLALVDEGFERALVDEH